MSVIVPRGLKGSCADLNSAGCSYRTTAWRGSHHFPQSWTPILPKRGDVAVTATVNWVSQRYNERRLWAAGSNANMACHPRAAKHP